MIVCDLLQDPLLQMLYCLGQSALIIRVREVQKEAMKLETRF